MARLRTGHMMILSLAWYAFLTTVLTACPDVPASEATESAILDAQPPAIRVQVRTVTRSPFDRSAGLSGVARANRRAILMAEVPGRVVERPFEVGATVEEDDVVLRLDDTNVRLEAQQAQVAVESRQTDVEFSQLQLGRIQKLHEQQAQPAAALEKAQYDARRAEDGLKMARAVQAKAMHALRETRIRAPFAGTIAEWQVDVGDSVAPGRPLVMLVDISHLRVVVGLTAAEAESLTRGGLSEGAEVPVIFQALGGLERTATLRSVGPSPDRQSGTYPAEFIVNNEDGRLREGLVAHLRLTAQAQQALVIPREAVLRVEGAPAVFVVEGQGSDVRARRRALRLGASAGDVVEVLEGLREGDRIVTVGHFALRDGAHVLIENRE